jgi:hypothetical protein
MALHTNLFPYCRFELKIEGKRGREKKGKKKIRNGSIFSLKLLSCNLNTETDRQTKKDKKQMTTSRKADQSMKYAFTKCNCGIVRLRIIKTSRGI